MFIDFLSLFTLSDPDAVGIFASLENTRVLLFPNGV